MLFMIMFTIVIYAFFAFLTNPMSDKVEREKISTGSVNETDYYTDELGWIEKPSTLLDGMKEFYKQTGVQPYLALVKPVSPANTDAECEAYAEKLYDELFTDEAHFLFVYVENLDPEELGYTAYVCGSAAKSVLDSEAIDIFYSNLDKNWFNNALNTSQVFGRTFDDTSKTIMRKQTNPYDVLKVGIIVGTIIIIFKLAIKWWNKRTEQKNKEQEDLQRILDTPLQTFGDLNLDELKKKYDD